MQTSKVLCSLSSSSRAWLARQNSDPYVKKRYSSPTIYRSRAAYKLIEIDDRFNFLTKPNVRTIIDLGASPGGWSQVVAERLGWTESTDKVMWVKRFGYGENGAKLNEQCGTWSSPKLEALKEMDEIRSTTKVKGKRKETPQVPAETEVFDPLNIDDDGADSKSPVGRGRIIAVDLLPMEPIPGVLDIRGNFLKRATQDKIRHFLKMEGGNDMGKADVILSDMARNVTGKTARDTEESLKICEMVFQFAVEHLRTTERKRMDSVLLIKFFSHELLYGFRDTMLTPNFNDVRVVKPMASRRESKEFYFLCRGWKGLC